MIVGACQDDSADLRRLAGARDAHRQRALGVEPLGHAGRERLVHMLHGDDRRAEVSR